MIVVIYDPGEGERTAAPSHCGRGRTHVPCGGLGILPVGDLRSDGDDAEGEQSHVQFAYHCRGTVPLRVRRVQEGGGGITGWPGSSLVAIVLWIYDRDRPMSEH